MQYAELLHKASESPDSCHRLAYLTAFIAAGYSCATRNKKPFNPLLGETFEFIPKDNKWKFFAEQVSHHPPIGIAEASSEQFTLHLEMELSTKFRGNYTEVAVRGLNQFGTKFGDNITWHHLETCAHNVIIGGMWVDHYGDLEIINHATGDKCVLKATRCGWIGAGRFEINGDIFDGQGNLRLKISGRWDSVIQAIKIKEGAPAGDPITLWKKLPAPVNKWNWPKFNEEMTEITPENEAILPPNDSRFRTDRRELEKGNIDFAGKEKHRLEEKQRSERKEREAKHDAYQPKYFKEENDPKLGRKFLYIGKYWEEKEQRTKNAKSTNSTPETNSTPQSTAPVEGSQKEEMK